MAYKFTELNIGPNDSDIIIDIAGLTTIPENYRDRELLRRATLWDSSTGIKYRCSYAEAATEGDLYYSCLDEGYHYYLHLNFGDIEISIEKHDAQHLPSEDEVNDLISAALDELDDHSTATNLTNGSGTKSIQQLNATASGIYSFAEGSYTTASGWYSHAEGDNTKASGNSSHAEGSYTTASGDYSHAEGSNTAASGKSSHAEGTITKASGARSHAEGYSTIASGECSHTEGGNTAATEYCSHAEGYYTTASGSASHAEGCETIASGDISHTEGTSAFFAYEYENGMPIATVQTTTNIIYGAYPEITINKPQFPTSETVVGMYMDLRLLRDGIIVADRSGPIRVTAVRQSGSSTEDYIYTLESALPATWSSTDATSCQVRLYSAGAKGILSHAEGATTSAIGRASHAEGFNTVADGQYSHAEGYNTVASGWYSHAGGDHTIANGRAQTAIGKYNEENYGALFIVGNGEDNNRKNAFEVYTDGHAEVQRVGDTPKSIVTKEYVIDLQNLIKITYSELKNLRDNKKLIPGQQYRIIDYKTTTSQENTCSAGHQFDIIVTADSTNTLNENARVISHDNLVWKANITPRDVQVLYKLTTSELSYNPPTEESSIVASLTTAINSKGEQVPAFIDPDPDGDGCYKNSLVSVQYVISDDEILYEGNSSVNEKDVFVELDYIDDTPVLYKTDPTNSDVDPNNRFEADYADIFYYSGVYTVDDVDYDKWDKYEADEFTGYIILTQHIVENNKFIITQEELINAISYEYIPSPGDCTYIYNGEYELDGEVYDFWIEEYPEDEGFYYGRLTNKVVDFGDPYFKNSNLAAWETKYCLDNDTDRFSWAGSDVEEPTITVNHNNAICVRRKEWDTRVANWSTDKPFVWYMIDGDWFSSSDSTEVTAYTIVLTDSETPKPGNSAEEATVSITLDSDGQFVPGGGNTLTITDYQIPGKGVIYYMKDDLNNEAPYDFKNIQFIRKLNNEGILDTKNGTDTWCYTFGGLTDRSTPQEDYDKAIFYNNSIGDYAVKKYSNDSYKYEGFTLPNNIFLSKKGVYNPISNSNKLGKACRNNTFMGGNEFNTLGNDCYNNTFGYGCMNNTFGNVCSYNTLGDSCSSNTFETECVGNIFGEDCCWNIIRTYCAYNSFSASCSYNTLGISCQSNTFGESCYGNMFGTFCSSNTFGNNCDANILAGCCFDYIFGNNYQYNSAESGTEYISLISYDAEETEEEDPIYVQHVRIGTGIRGDSSTNPKVLTVTRGTNYEQKFISANSKEIIV